MESLLIKTVDFLQWYAVILIAFSEQRGFMCLNVPFYTVSEENIPLLKKTLAKCIVYYYLTLN